MMSGNIKVILEGKGPLTLRESNYVTSGGEGAIYRAGGTIIKIYADTQKMIRETMPEKVHALAAIKHAAISTPAGVVFDDAQRHPIGFYMPFVTGDPMPRVFTTDFRTRSGFDDGAARKVSAIMREAVQYAHDHGAVLVDANEFNWIVSDTFWPTVIDVDSWAIGRWPATVIMPSIHDHHSKTFTALTDWFSWGVVAFQVFTGIHPYKGKLDGYKPSELERRMKDNASVFSSGVRLPLSARDPHTSVPGPLLEWFKATFQDGKRTPPPSPHDTPTKLAPAARVLRAVISSNQALIHDLVYRAKSSPVVRVWPSGVALLANGQIINLATASIIRAVLSTDVEVVPAAHGFLVADWSGEDPMFSYFDGMMNHPLRTILAIDRVFRADDKMFAVTADAIIELGVENSFDKPVLTCGRAWGISPNACHWFENIIVQDVLGAAFLVIPTKQGIAQVRVKELDGLTPIAGHGHDRFAAVVASDRSGTYHRIEFTFAADHNSYTVWKGHNDGPDLNMVAMPSGVAVTIIDDGELVIFVPTNGKVNKIQDRGIATTIRLSRWDSKVVYIRDGNVWRVQVK